MKYLHVTMPDSSVWKINANVIAEDRADYYSDIKDEDFDQIFDETLEHSDILIDWAENNMGWHNVEQYAVKVKSGKVDYEDGWCNGHKRIIEE